MPTALATVIPDKLKIGTRNVLVKLVPDPTVDGEVVMGYFDPNKQIIAVNSNIESPDVLIETFWHELVHAINDYVRFNVEFAKEVADADSEEIDAFKFQETFTENFSKVLMATIKDNNLLAI